MKIIKDYRGFKMVKQTAGRDFLGGLAPKFAQLNDDVLFGEIWSREDKLSLRDRSMITIAALMGAKNFPQVKAHLEIGKAHGITKTEAVEIVTQLGFYTGWPNAWTVFPMIEEIYADEEEDIHGGIFGMGDPNDAYAEFFVGQSYLKPIAINEDIPTFVGNVTFEPGCRNNWHIHKASKGGGQILIGVEGEGWYQEEGKEPQKMVPGTVIIIPPNVKHWHGASKDEWFSHLAIEIPGEDSENQWLEAVSDEEYLKL